MSIIEVKNLKKYYTYYRKLPGFWGSVKAFFARENKIAKAVDGISFSIEEGELVGFLGPNGAGKTTTLKMLSGINEATGGEAQVLGYTPWKREHAYQKQFAIVMGQKNQLWEDLPPRESFMLNQALYEVPLRQFRRTEKELIDTLGIADVIDVPARKLSLGQRMKCELAASLLHQPKVLFLDEPTIGLDVVAQKNIRDFIKRWNREHHTTILLTSHYMEDIRQLCERVIIINKGRIMYDGKLQALIDRYAPHKLLKVTLNGEGYPCEKLSRFGEVAACSRYEVTFKVPRAKTREVATKLLNSDVPVDDIMIDEVGVDEVIRSLFMGK